MTIDQGNSALGESLDRNPTISTFRDSSRQTTARVPRIQSLRDAAGRSAPHSGRAPEHLRGGFAICKTADYPAPAKEARIGDVGSATEQLFLSAHEDITRLNDILRAQRCVATMHGVDGVVLPLDAASDGTGGFVQRSTHSLSAPIFDVDGSLLASLEVTYDRAHRSESAETLLRALIESASHAIAERWFRLAYRRQWVVAVLRRDTPHAYMIFAVDRDQRVLCFDHKTRQFLKHKGRTPEAHVPFSTYFISNSPLLRRRGYGDASLILREPVSGDTWMALVTPPLVSVVGPDHDGCAMLHARPRLNSLSRLLLLAPEGEEHGGISRWALKRINDYIHANLGSALDIDELAALVRMSSSHFTRSFHKTVGLTPHRYVVQCRVTRARELLAATDLPLTEIALTIGFSDQSHFSRRFQELVGVPPGAYRRNDVCVQR